MEAEAYNNDDYCACKFCETQTTYTATKLCNNCWEVEKRLPLFLKSEKARCLVIELLEEH